jgi:hypothetical protein
MRHGFYQGGTREVLNSMIGVQKYFPGQPVLAHIPSWIKHYQEAVDNKLLTYANMQARHNTK